MKLVFTFMMGIVFCGVGMQSVIAQNSEIAREIERLETSRLELTQQREQLKQRFEIEEDASPRKKAQEIQQAMREVLDSIQTNEFRLAQARSEMQRRVNRQDQESQAKADRNQARFSDRDSSGRESRGRNEPSDRRGRQPEPAQQQANNQLNHLREAVSHLRHAGKNEMADALEREIRGLAGRVARMTKNSPQMRDRSTNASGNRPNRQSDRVQPSDQIRIRDQDRAGQVERERREPGIEREREMERQRQMERREMERREMEQREMEQREMEQRQMEWREREQREVEQQRARELNEMKQRELEWQRETQRREQEMQRRQVEMERAFEVERREFETQRQREMENRDSRERELEERLQNAINEFSQGFRQMKNELQTLHEQIENIKRNIDR